MLPREYTLSQYDSSPPLTTACKILVILIDNSFVEQVEEYTCLKSKDWLGRNQNNMSEWSDISIRGLLFQ
jgi:hypothetical protein